MKDKQPGGKIDIFGTITGLPRYFFLISQISNVGYVAVDVTEARRKLMRLKQLILLATSNIKI